MYAFSFKLLNKIYWHFIWFNCHLFVVAIFTFTNEMICLCSTRFIHWNASNSVIFVIKKVRNILLIHQLNYGLTCTILDKVLRIEVNGDAKKCENNIALKQSSTTIKGQGLGALCIFFFLLATKLSQKRQMNGAHIVYWIRVHDF